MNLSTSGTFNTKESIMSMVYEESRVPVEQLATRTWYEFGHTEARQAIADDTCLLLCEAREKRNAAFTFSDSWFYWYGYMDEINGQLDFQL